MCSVRLARALQAQPNLNETLQAIAMAAVANIDGADVAGITLDQRRRQDQHAGGHG